MKQNKGPEAGIYVIEITGCGKFYIGSTLDLKRRKRDHELLLIKNSHKNLHLQNAYNKYGKDSYKFGTIAICEKNKDFLLDLEQRLIDSYDFSELFNLNRFTRAGHTKKDIDYSFVENIFKDTANGVTRHEILKKYSINMASHRQIIIRETYGWIKIDDELVAKAQNTIKKNTRYSKSDLSFIRKNIHKGVSYLSHKLDRTESAIVAQVCRMKIDRGYSLSPDAVTRMFELLKAGVTVIDTSRIIGCHERTIYRKITARKLLEQSSAET
jgi:group I intron endonuclease